MAPTHFINVYEPDKLITAKEAAQWMYPNRQKYYKSTDRSKAMIRWLTDHGIKPVGKATDMCGKWRVLVNVYRLGDVVDELCNS